MKDHMLILRKKFSALYTAPARVIVFSFIFVILIGGFLLSLPVSSKDGVTTGFFDSLFTATSATCVTGFVLFDTYTKWTLFGQSVILLLVQVGGMGIVTISIFFYVVAGKKLGLRGMHLAKESINIIDASNLAGLFKFIVITTFSIEFIGACILSLVFVSEYGVLKGVYISFFLAISAFCNAGFDVLGFQAPYVSIMNYNNNPIVIYTIGVLIILGGLGFIVWYDLFNNGKQKWLLHTKVVLIMTFLLIVIGVLVFFILECNNPLTLKNLTWPEKFNAAFFQSVTLRTAGFTSINFTNLKQITKMVALIIMLIGGAPGSTSGGIKITTLAILVMTVISVIKNKPETIILKHKVPRSTVYKSVSMFILSIVVVILGAIVLYYSVNPDQDVSIISSIFETISAFSTVGISTGVVGATGACGKLIVIFIMFIGRVGPISLLLSLAMRTNEDVHKIFPQAKIMVT